MSKTTVIIPNYNGIKYLGDCLESLERQTSLPDVLLIDNASTDGSREWIIRNCPPEKKLSDGRIIHYRLINHSTNKGFSEAVNTGILNSATDYVFLLNNDTVCRNDTVEKLEYAMDHKRNAFSVQALMVSMKNPDRIDDSGDYYCAMGWAFTAGKDRSVSSFTRRKSVTSTCAGAAIYRRSAFDKVGLFDPVHFCYLEDVDIGYRARLHGYVNMIEPEAVVLHAGSATSGSRYNEFKQKLTAGNNLYLIYKNMPAVQILINLPLLLAGIIIKLAFFSRKGLGRSYLQGLAEGISKIRHNRNRKVKLPASAVFNYFIIQLELWGNILLLLAR
jgi:GT2 family glycosyltransferase